MKSSKRARKQTKPDMKWQVGEYNRYMEFKSHIPYQFLLLCRIVEVTPQQLLIDFMDNLSCSSWKREGRDEAKGKLIEYFVCHGYGQEHYSIEEIKEMFKEMDAVGMLFPHDSSNMIDRYAKWRKKHHKYWFKKWFFKNQRKALKAEP
ncbi:MAG: hypothetical protein EOP48_01355 [Sphingobacteriales bacterium]|nr:MAG: hypothetical protein EOP48_01355 [Sphingobacteriales bacterium]